MADGAMVDHQLEYDVSAGDAIKVATRLTMSECYERPQRIEHQTRAHQTIDVQLSKVLDGCYTLLVRTVYVLFQPPTYVFENLIYNSYGESRMITLQVVRQHREKTDVTVFDFPRFRENLVQRALYNRIVPIQFSDELEHFIDSSLRKNIKYKVTNEKLHWGSLLLDTRSTLGRVALDRYSVSNSRLV
jgi:hypothetical protein